MKQRVYEGTWEEVRERDAELAGKRVRLTVLGGAEDRRNGGGPPHKTERKSALGKYAGIMRSSEEYMREKQAEIEREDRPRR